MIDYETEKRLVDDKLFDSFDLVTLVSELCDTFDIEITAREFIPENFNHISLAENLINILVHEGILHRL